MRRSNLEDNTNGKDDTAADDGGATSEEICAVTCNDGAKESTGREDTGEKRLVLRSDDELVGWGIVR